MKLSPYQKALQNTISFSQSSSFFRKPGQSWRNKDINGASWLLPALKPRVFFFSPPFFCSVSRSWAAAGFRFVLPLYKSPKSYSGTSKGSMCLPKYIGILPQPGCFQNLKRFKVAPFHGSEWGFCPVLFSCKFSVYNLYFLLVGHLVHSSALIAPTSYSKKSFASSEIHFNLSIIFLPSRCYSSFFLNSIFGHFEKQEITLYHVALRVPGLLSLLRGADANLVPHREAVGSQEELDTVEVLLPQIPHPLQRIILATTRVSVGFVGRAGSCNCVTVSRGDTTPTGVSQHPTGGW